MLSCCSQHGALGAVRVLAAAVPDRLAFDRDQHALMHIERPAVVAGQPVHVGRIGHDQQVDARLRHRGPCLGDARVVFRAGEIEFGVDSTAPPVHWPDARQIGWAPSKHRGQYNGQRRDRGDRRIDREAQIVPHAPRQRHRARAGQEQRHHQLIERGDEGEQRADQHAGPDQRQRDLAERAPRRRAEAERRLLQPPIEAGQAGADAGHHERHGEAGVRQHQPERRADQPVAREGVVDADGHDDHRHDQRRHDQRRQRSLRGSRGRRARPSAASVPSTVASTTTAPATHRLSQVDCQPVLGCRDRRDTSASRSAGGGKVR